jgi:hypothetical protein
MTRNSIDIVYPKYRQGLKKIRNEHQQFFSENAFTIFDRCTFQYVDGTTETYAEPSYYLGRNYHKLPKEITSKVEKFIVELFEWVKAQKFEN